LMRRFLRMVSRWRRTFFQGEAANAMALHKTRPRQNPDRSWRVAGIRTGWCVPLGAEHDSVPQVLR
jgi:hypothetical protein